MRLAALLRGAGEGATGGLVKYPAAGLMFAMDKLVGEGKLSYDEALKLIREQRAADIEESPVLHTVGNVAGALVPLGVIARGGATLGKVIAGNAALGGAQGFSANAAEEGTTLQDTLVGTGLGAGVGALGAGLTAAGQAVARTEVANALYAKLLENTPWRNAVKKQLQAAGEKATSDKIKAAARTEAKRQAEALPQREAAAIVQPPKSNLGQRAAASVARGLTGVVPSAATGAVIGGGGALISGSDPLQGAMLGAGTAVGASKAAALGNVGKTLSHATGRLMARNPVLPNLPRTLTTTATNTAVPVLTVNPNPLNEAELTGMQANPRKVSGKVDDFSDLSEFEVPQSAQADPFEDLAEFEVR